MNSPIFKLGPQILDQIADTLKALGHPYRLRILEVLAGGETSVTAIQQTLALPQAIVSQQLKIMRAGGVVTSRRQGTLSLYRLANPGLPKLLNCLYSCQDHCLRADVATKPSSSKKRRNHE